MPSKPYPLMAVNGGINLLRPKGAADPKALYDLLNGFVTQAGTIKVRPGTFRNANIAQYSGVGFTKGLVAYQGKLHVFSNAVVEVPPDYELHVLTHPGANQLNSAGTGGDPDFGSLAMLLPLEGSLIDLSAHLYVPTETGGAAFDSSHELFGNQTLLLNGADSGLAVPMTAPLELTSVGSFTVEGWFRTTNSHAGEKIVWACGQVSSGTFVQGFVNGNAQVEFQSSGAGSTPLKTAATDNAWHHIAWCYNGATTNGQVFVDGVGGSALPMTLGSAPTGADFTIGYNGLSAIQGTWLAGNVSQFRVTDAVRYTANFTPPTSPFPGSPSYGPIKEIHFAQPFLGGLYVVAEFDVNSAIAAEMGTVFHFWIQSSEGGDNTNAWQKNTDYRIGDVVIPTSPNGLTYIAARRGAANPLWTPSTLKVVGAKVEPTIPNGFFYTATSVAGDNPSTGTSEPVWPAEDGASVQENSALANDQTVTLATAAPNAPVPTVPAKYDGTIAGGFAGGGG